MLLKLLLNAHSKLPECEVICVIRMFWGIQTSTFHTVVI